MGKWIAVAVGTVLALTGIGWWINKEAKKKAEEAEDEASPSHA